MANTEIESRFEWQSVIFRPGLVPGRGDLQITYKWDGVEFDTWLTDKDFDFVNVTVEYRPYKPKECKWHFQIDGTSMKGCKMQIYVKINETSEPEFVEQVVVF